MKYLLFSFLLLTFYAQCNAQTDTIYIDKYSHKVEKSEASYFRIISPYNVETDKRALNDYYLNGNHHMSGFYFGSETEIMEGHFVFYYLNGRKSDEGEYKDDLKAGKWKSWYRNGQPKEIRNFDLVGRIEVGDGVGVLEHWDSLGNQLVVNGIGEYTSYDEYGYMSSKGRLKNAKQVGNWISYYLGEIIYKDYYNENGELSFGTIHNPYGEEVSYNSISVSPTPKNGMPAFYGYVNKNINYPEVARRMGASGVVYIQFVVEKDGSISKVKVMKGIGWGCDEQAAKVIRHSPKWNSGRYRGRPAAVRMMVPISFGLSSEKNKKSHTR